MSAKTPVGTPPDAAFFERLERDWVPLRASWPSPSWSGAHDPSEHLPQRTARLTHNIGVCNSRIPTALLATAPSVTMRHSGSPARPVSSTISPCPTRCTLASCPARTPRRGSCQSTRPTRWRSPGVVAVLTARDLPVADIKAAVDGRVILLALDRVLHVGQPVAAVLAETEARGRGWRRRGSGRVRAAAGGDRSAARRWRWIRRWCAKSREASAEELAMHGATIQEEDRRVTRGRRQRRQPHAASSAATSRPASARPTW